MSYGEITHNSGTLCLHCTLIPVPGMSHPFSIQIYLAESGCSRPAMIRSVVVFPHPEDPSRVTNSPFFAVRQMVSRTSSPSWKLFFMFFSSNEYFGHLVLLLFAMISAPCMGLPDIRLLIVLSQGILLIQDCLLYPAWDFLIQDCLLYPHRTSLIRLTTHFHENYLVYTDNKFLY